jgi:hypothetical protein
MRLGLLYLDLQNQKDYLSKINKYFTGKKTIISFFVSAVVAIFLVFPARAKV